MSVSSKEFKDHVSNMVLVPKSLYEKCLNHLDHDVRDLASSVNIRQLNNFCKADQPKGQRWGLSRNDILEKINIKYIDKEANNSQGQVNIENVKKNEKSGQSSSQASGQVSDQPSGLINGPSESSDSIQGYPTLLQNQQSKAKYVSEMRSKLATDMVDQQQNSRSYVPAVDGSEVVKLGDDDDDVAKSNLQNEQLEQNDDDNSSVEKDNTVDQIQSFDPTSETSSVQNDNGDNNNNLQQTDNFQSHEEQVSSEQNILDGLIPKLTKSQFSRLKWENAPPLTQSYYQVKRLAKKQIDGLKTNENNFRAQLRNYLRKDDLKKNEGIKGKHDLSVDVNDTTDLQPSSPKVLTKEIVQKEALSPIDVKTDINMLDNQKLTDLADIVNNKKEDIFRYERLLHGTKTKKQFKKGSDNSTAQWKKRLLTKKLGQARIDYMKLLDIYNDALHEKISDQEKKREKLIQKAKGSTKVKVKVTDDDLIPLMVDLEKEKQKGKSRKRKLTVVNDTHNEGVGRKRLRKMEQDDDNTLKVKVVDDTKVDVVKDISQKKGIKRKKADSLNAQNSDKKVKTKTLGTRKRKAADEVESIKKKKKKEIAENAV